MEKLTEAFNSPVSSYFSMGGYAAYVWPSYALALVLLLWLGISSMRSLRRAKRTLSSLNATDEA